LPKGHCFRLNLLSTWGDAHYIGLNGIEFYDSFGSPIISSGQIDFKLGAEPASVSTTDPLLHSLTQMNIF